MKYELKDYELDWVLAGLRLLDEHLLKNQVLYESATSGIVEIACERKKPTAAMVSKLCEDLNTHQRSKAHRPDEEEARLIAEDEPLPEEHSYVQGSFEIDSVEAVTMHGPKQVTDALRDALSEILEEPGLVIPEELRKAGIEACKAHERTLAKKGR